MTFQMLKPVTPPDKRRVEKWLIIQRIEQAGKGEDAYELLTAPGNRTAFIKWGAPIASVYYDDPETVYFIEQLGLDPEVIMA